MENQIFITGVTGFIGSNLLNKLIKENSKISLMVRKPINLPKNINCFLGDLNDSQTITSAIKGCSVIFHCAAYISFQKKDFDNAYQVNVVGTKNILESAYQAGVEKVIHLSACAVLGFSKDKNVILDETANPQIEKNNVYAYTKKLAEDEVQKYVQKGLDVSIANIATVYGQGDRKLNSGSVIKSVYEGKMNLVPPGGTSFVSVDDLVNGLILLAEKGKPGERYIFCTENMEYKTLVQRIARTLGVKEPKNTLPRISYYPALCAVKGMELLSGLMKKEVNLMTPQILKESFGYKYFNSAKAKNELGWKPLQTFEEAVEKAFNYYKENNLI
jgi:nucleoside-diphosphate-sugar epimerase